MKLLPILAAVALGAAVAAASQAGSRSIDVPATETAPAVVAGAAMSLPTPRSATVRVVDGDTIVVGDEHIRLWGFDAPESRQSCMIDGVDHRIGDEATEGLKAILAAGDLHCEVRDRDRYGRTVAECWAGGHSVGDAMVSSGWAWALPRYSKDRFLPEQEEAERAGRGVWSGHGNCEAPARFRQEHLRN